MHSIKRINTSLMKKKTINTGFYLSLLIFACSSLFISCKKDNSTAPNSPTAMGVTAKDFLSSSYYTKLQIEVQFVYGYKPTPTAIENIKSFLQQRINKPGGIEIIYTTIEPSSKTVYTIDDIRNIEKANRTIKNNESTLSAYILFLDGEYSQNTENLKTLGVAYGPSSLAIFENAIRDLSGGLGQPSITSVETTVTEHEFCHVFGLVNNGTALTSAHQDAAHGKHCNNTNCLMYYATETSDIINNLLGNNIPSLDQNCINDLKANGGK